MHYVVKVAVRDLSAHLCIIGMMFTITLTENRMIIALAFETSPFCRVSGVAGGLANPPAGELQHQLLLGRCLREELSHNSISP